MASKGRIQRLEGPKAPYFRDENSCAGLGKPREQFQSQSVRGLARTINPENGQPYGLGAALSPTIEDLRSRANCPLLTMPTVIEVDWLLGGPQSDESIEVSFGAEIDPFHSGRSPNIEGVVSTNLAMPGETQTHMIVCGIGWHFEPESFVGTILGNATNHPTTGTTKLPSPDVFTDADLANGFGGGALPAGTVYLPAVLEWGVWAEIVAWKMAQAYDLRWMVGTNCNILLDSLRNTAYVPPSAQTGSASDSQIDVDFLVNETNVFYNKFLGTSLNFMKVDTIRIGSTGVAGANVGAFRPSRDLELMDATYGGIGLSGLLQGNTEFRPLSMPYIIKAGIPVGLKIEERDTDIGDEMRAWLAASGGFGGGVPPSFTDDPFWVAGPGAAFNERTLDGLNTLQTMLSQRAVFKGGRLNIKVKLKGFEITEDLYTLMANNPDIRDAICAECGIRFAQQGAAS
jgi:hypothetical protein